MRLTATPPRPRGLPLVGHALSLAADPLGYLSRQYHAHGPVFRLQILQRPLTVLAGPEANLFIAREGGQHLAADELWQRFNRAVGIRELLPGMDGERHQRLRTVIKQGYTRRAIVESFPAMLRVVDDVARGLRPGQRISAVELVRRIITDQLGLVVVGRTAGAYFRDFVIFVNTLLNATVVKRWPELALYRPRYRRAQRRVLEFAREIVAAHRRAPRAADGGLVGALLAAKEKDADILTEQELLLNVAGPFIAGLDTATNTAAFLLYALLKNPQVLARVTDEVDRVFAAPGNEGVLTLDSLHTMTALHGALMETMRLYPITPGLHRTTVRPFEFAGYRVDAGQEVLFATAVSHFLPRFFPNPYSFDIDRFTPPRNEHQQKGAFAPFGLGAHTCLGAGIAEIQILLTAAKLLHRRKWTIDPPHYQLKTSVDPVLTPGPGFRVRMI
jgi:cytochrome P450